MDRIESPPLLLPRRFLALLVASSIPLNISHFAFPPWRNYAYPPFRPLFPLVFCTALARFFSLFIYPSPSERVHDDL